MGGNNTPGGTAGREEIMTVIELSSAPAPNTFPTVISSPVLRIVRRRVSGNTDQAATHNRTVPDLSEAHQCVV